MKYGSVSAPAGSAFAVTPSDTTVIKATALYVGGAGDVAVKMEDGNIVTFVGVTVGTVLPIRVSQVRTATTATNILGLRP